MRRYWIEKNHVQQDKAVIDGDSFHHIFQVCRQAVGSKFEILCGDQKAHFVEVEQVGKKSAIVKLLESRAIPEIAKPHIHLLISVPRFQVMDAIVEKAVELGVKSIQPFFSDFSFVRSKSTLPDNKVERWEKIVVSATQQSGRGDLMPVLPVLEKQQAYQFLQDQLNPNSRNMGLFAYEGVGVFAAKTYLENETQRLQNLPPQEIWVLVGGEGGFSQTEVQDFKQLGLAAVTLGEQVLRVETACIALVSILKYHFDLMR